MRPLTELDPVASIVVVSLCYSPLDATANPSQPATKSVPETERAAKFYSGMLEEMGAVGKSTAVITPGCGNCTRTTRTTIAFRGRCR